jgi:cytochrome oxidase assembly protein ShyY1
LGSWQVYRRQWKLDLIDRLDQLIKEPAIDFPEE